MPITDEWDETAIYLLNLMPMPRDSGMPWVASYHKTYPEGYIPENPGLGQYLVNRVGEDMVTLRFWDGHDFVPITGEDELVPARGPLYSGPKLTVPEIVQKYNEFYGTNVTIPA